MSGVQIMAHTHAANAADFLKHTVEAEVLEELSLLFETVRYIDPYCGQGLYHRPRGVYYPDTTHSKYPIFQRYQAALPEWYLGSPLVALAALQQAKNAVLDLSDEDPSAVEALRDALDSDLVHSYVLRAAGEKQTEPIVQLSARQYDPTRLELSGGEEAVNVILLDPTYPSGYASMLKYTVQTCASSSAQIVVMAWGLERWSLGDVFASMDYHWEAQLADHGEVYEMNLSVFNIRHSRLTEVVEKVTSGW